MRMSFLESLSPTQREFVCKTARFGDDHRTYLHEAAEYAYPKVVQFFINNGANLNATNKFQQTPLDLAVMHLKLLPPDTGSEEEKVIVKEEMKPYDSDEDDSDDEVDDALLDLLDRRVVVQLLRSHGAQVGVAFRFADIPKQSWTIEEYLRTDIRLSAERFRVKQGTYESFARSWAVVSPGIFMCDTAWKDQMVKVPKNVLHGYLRKLHVGEEETKKFMESILAESEDVYGGTKDHFWAAAAKELGEEKKEELLDWLERELAVFHLEAIWNSAQEEGIPHANWAPDLRATLDKDVLDGIEFDKNLVKLYTQDGNVPNFFSVLNRHLQGQLKTSRLYAAAKSLSYALYRISEAEPERNFMSGKLYRVVSLDEDDFRCYVRRAEMGDGVILWRSFASTTTSKQVAQSFCGMSNDDDAKMDDDDDVCTGKRAVFEIDVQLPEFEEFRYATNLFRFVDIRNLSDREEEQEVLVQAGTPFRIVKAECVNGRSEFGCNVKYIIRMVVQWNQVHLQERLLIHNPSMRDFISIRKIKDLPNGTTTFEGVSLAPEKGGMTFGPGRQTMKSKLKDAMAARRGDLKAQIPTGSAYLNDLVEWSSARNATYATAVVEENACQFFNVDLSTCMTQADSLWSTEHYYFEPLDVVGNPTDVSEYQTVKMLQSEVDGEMSVRCVFEDLVDLDTVTFVLPTARLTRGRLDAEDKLTECPRIFKIVPFDKEDDLDISDLQEWEPPRCRKAILTDDDVDVWAKRKDMWRYDVDVSGLNSFNGVKCLIIYVSLREMADYDEYEDEDGEIECELIKVEFWGRCGNRIGIDSARITEMAQAAK